ncbi:NrfD/PsrC family molybdoenzyme membrane anchor subunit [Carboxylicivirga caseinilyticus]|uniref:NrfD/PsrC family molybdoenzyme membrane anchor subunit n=1 Tax=Carboxylicivirga caseinilyticus TaxID=3417572 RepID=UPI003D34099C|nr:polysulfide reductase NrfD [Marinilabiliaceae bacterium A049]
MREELIVSGRMNPHIDPQLHIWEWQIPAYLFLGGLAAGILFFAGYYFIKGKSEEYPTAVKLAPIFVPVFLALGLFFLFLDLKHKLYFWRLYTAIKLESPMSWGAWTLMIITPLSMVWAALHIKSLFPKWDWKFDFVKDIIKWLEDYKTPVAWAMMILAVILGIYTGILLSAFNARPLWNTSILGPLFLVSGLSTGAAAIIIMSKSSAERHMFAKIDLVLIAVELFLIIHMFMGFRASTQVQIDAASMFLGGQFTAPFWVFVVGLGLLVPASLEVMELRNKKIHYMVAPALVLFGGLLFRFIMAYAGQMSRWLY